MLKGHAKIELTNVNTGETNVYEKHNLITDAYSHIINNRGFYGSPVISDAFFPSAHSLMVGQNLFATIMLFDGALNDNPSDFFIPSYVDCVGIAGSFAYSNTMSNRGSFDAIESAVDFQNKTMKFVWTFNTSQGNGTIASLGLASKEVGYMGWNNKEDEYDSETSSNRTFHLGSRTESFTALTDMYLYHDGTYMYGIKRYNIRNNGSEHHVKNTGKIQIVKKYFPTKNVSIFSTPTGYNNLLDAYEIDLPAEMKEIVDTGTHSNLYYFVQYDSGYLYIYVAKSQTIPADSDFIMLRYDISNGNQTILRLHNPANFPLVLGNSGNGSGIWYRTETNVYVHKDKIFLTCQDSANVGWYMLDMISGTIQKVLLNNGKNGGVSGNQRMVLAMWFGDYMALTYPGVQPQIVNTNTGVSFRLSAAADGGIFNNNSNSNSQTARTFIPATYDTLITPYFVYTYSGGTALNREAFDIRMHPFALLTKNNLEEPVVKTSEQTMKITYTLYEN